MNRTGHWKSQTPSSLSLFFGVPRKHVHPKDACAQLAWPYGVGLKEAQGKDLSEHEDSANETKLDTVPMYVATKTAFQCEQLTMVGSLGVYTTDLKARKDQGLVLGSRQGGCQMRVHAFSRAAT